MEDLGKGDSLFVDCRVICVMARGQCLMQRGVDRMEKASVTMGPFQAYQHFDMDTFQGQKPDEDFRDSVSLRMFDKLLTVCARSGDHDLAVKLIEQMERSGTKIGYVALGSVVKAFCRGGKLKEAACFLQELPADQTSIVMYNTVLAECAKQGRGDLFETCLLDMQSKGIIRDEQIWVNIIRMRSKQSLESLQNEWQNFLVTGHETGGYAVRIAYVSGLAWLDEADAAWTAMNDMLQQFPLDSSRFDFEQLHRHYSIGWHALLACCARKKDYNRCLEILRQMNASGFKKNILIYNEILANMHTANRPSLELKAHKLLILCNLSPSVQALVEEFEQKGILANQQTYLWLLSSFRKENDIEGLQTSWRDMVQAGIAPCTRCYNELLMACSCMGDIAQSERIFEALCRSAHQPDQCTFLSLFGAISMHVSKERARTKGSLDLKLPAQTRTWAVVYSTFRKREDEMTNRFKLKFSGALLTTLIKGYGQMASMKDILRVMQTAQRQGLKPDLSAYNTAIAAAASIGDMAMAFSLLEQMQDGDILPDVRTFNGLLMLYTRKNKPSSDPWDVILKIKASGLIPNAVTLNILLNTCTTDAELGTYMSWIASSSIRPRLDTWKRIIKKHIDLNCAHLLQSVFELMHQDERDAILKSLDS